MAQDHSLKSQTLASSSDPNEDQVTTNECDHAELVESKDCAEPGMNTSTNKQVCLSGSWKEWVGHGEGRGGVCHQLLVALRELRTMLGRAASEHLEEPLDKSPLDKSRSLGPTKPGQREVLVCRVQKG